MMDERKRKIIQFLLDSYWAEWSLLENDFYLTDNAIALATFPESECYFDVLEFVTGIKNKYKL